MKNKHIKGYNTQIFQLLSTLLFGSQKFNTLQVEW